MTTLFNSERDPNRVNKMQMEEFLTAITEIAVNTSVTIDQALKAAEILELRRANNLSLVDGEFKDKSNDSLLSQLNQINESLATLLQAELNG